MKNKFIFVFLICLLILIACLYLVFSKHGKDKAMLSFECYAERYRILGANESPPYEKSILRYRTEYNGQGFYNLNGLFDDGKQQFKISRTVNFSYVPLGKDTYRMTINKIDIDQRDNLPEELYKRYFLDRVNLSRTSKITPLGTDAYILGNLVTPVSVCTQLR